MCVGFAERLVFEYVVVYVAVALRLVKIRDDKAQFLSDRGDYVVFEFLSTRCPDMLRKGNVDIFRETVNDLQCLGKRSAALENGLVRRGRNLF